ncbi:uncharacterized protein Z519_10507 [Cladophialophora bantiana CBS 173.52]|uniref:Uncharacterized protein n=1 Tax=Cladophialophora bantiana (strain ATCC 10958 / CBS 173.52 / CDC B-1940 / NIH 8579) TaxID=1442370 RepID=A0A0D2FR40_CLAB1|nr:uncharacterized protein Z519_10507 [Cladophialophora bantiana CBS 173.52]KIW89022.1 hypothetical protein Z519_10507 [Cladophialophora bantiana CBS 173.52]
MDDGHAHPQSPAPTLHVRSRSIPPSLREYPSSHATPKSAPHTRQQRLLQTRHAKFSAQSLSVNGINVPFPPLTRSTENDSSYFSSPRFNRGEENGNDSNKAEKLSNASIESAILTEISNANACRIRGLKKRAAIPIFQDSPDKPTVRGTGANTPSVYHDASSDIHAPSFPNSGQDSPTNMGLREVSVNLQRPSPHKDSPYHRSVRLGLNRKGSQGKPRFNSDEYIEHIENELQMVKDAMYSPTTHMPWKEKLRKAKEENDRLKKEMNAIRASFEFELHETVERSAETELKLKRRIKDLEDEVELKKSVIHDLECDREEKRSDQNALEVLKARIEKLEEERLSLETTNRDMTKRNEVLTQLLALSPTKAQPTIGIPTPRQKSGRPMSLIIPRLPTSPGFQTSQSRPQSVIASPALAASDYFPAHLPSSPLSSCPFDSTARSPEAIDDRHSIDSVLEESDVQVGNEIESRRSTLVSSPSDSPDMPGGGHIRAESRSQTVMRHPSKRRPRKFMPGSTQLKPLLLPTFTAENGNLPSTSPIASPTRPLPIQVSSQIARCEPPSLPHSHIGRGLETPFPSPESVSGRPGPAFQSLDEVFASDGQCFQPDVLDEPLDELSFSRPVTQYRTPLQNGNIVPGMESCSSPRISSWVSKTISSLPKDVGCNSRHAAVTIAGVMCEEGRGISETGKIFDQQDIASDVDNVDVFQFRDSVEIPRPLFSKHRTRGGGHSISHIEYPESPLNPRKRRKTSSICEFRCSRVDIINQGSRNVEACPYSGREDVTPGFIVDRKIKRSMDDYSTFSKKQGTIQTRSSLEIIQHRSIGSRPLATLTIQTVYATLSRYATYIQGFKRDPLSLARRVIANAWRSNWAMFGKLSWWVLGLFVGYRRRPTDQQDWDWAKYDGESIANRCCLLDVDERPIKDPPLPAAEIDPPFAGGKIEEQENTARTPSTPPAAASSKPKSGWGRSLYLWGKFSVAIMLAVGGAIIKGPAEMLRDADDRRKSQRNSLAEDVVAHCGSERGQSDNAYQVTGDPNQVWDGHRGGPPRINDTPDVGRKARSFSSPPTSSPIHLRTTRGASEHTPHRDRLTEGISYSSRERTSGEYLACWTEDTLKPARSNRKGLDSVFQTPDHVKSASAQSIGATIMYPSGASMNQEQQADFASEQRM